MSDSVGDLTTEALILPLGFTSSPPRHVWSSLRCPKSEPSSRDVETFPWSFSASDYRVEQNGTLR